MDLTLKFKIILVLIISHINPVIKTAINQIQISHEKFKKSIIIFHLRTNDTQCTCSDS